MTVLCISCISVRWIPLQVTQVGAADRLFQRRHAYNGKMNLEAYLPYCITCCVSGESSKTTSSPEKTHSKLQHFPLHRLLQAAARLRTMQLCS